MDLGGVEGGEGKRVGTRDEGEEGSLGEERGKNMRGWMGETGEGETRGEEGFGPDVEGDSGEGWAVCEEEVVQVSRVERRGGEVGSRDEPGAGDSTSGHTGLVGEVYNGMKLVGAEGSSWSKAANAWPSSGG